MASGAFQTDVCGMMQQEEGRGKEEEALPAGEGMAHVQVLLSFTLLHLPLPSPQSSPWHIEGFYGINLIFTKHFSL